MFKPLLVSSAPLPQRAREEGDAVARDLQERLWDAEQRCRTALVERDELLKRYDEAVQRYSSATAAAAAYGSIRPVPSGQLVSGGLRPAPVADGETVGGSMAGDLRGGDEDGGEFGTE